MRCSRQFGTIFQVSSESKQTIEHPPVGFETRKNDMQSSHSSPQPPDAKYDPNWYVHRTDEEHDAVKRLEDVWTPVAIQGPEGSGKATLLAYLLEEKKKGAQNSRSVQIRLQGFSTQDFSDLDSFLRKIARQITRQTDLATEHEVSRIWNTKTLTPISKLSKILEKLVLPNVGLLLLSFEQTELLQEYEWRDEFFGMMRFWVNERPPDEKKAEFWARLRLLVTVAIEPTLLETFGAKSAFFAIAVPIRMSAFTKEQLKELAHKYGLFPDDGQLNTLLDLVGGHPGLVRIALFKAAQGRCDIGTLLRKNDPNELFADHLTRIEGWIKANNMQQAVTTVLQQKPLELSVYSKLYSKGIIIRHGLEYSFVCPLLKHFIAQRFMG